MTFRPGISVWAVVLATVALAGGVAAADDSHPLVPAFERFYAAGKGDAAQGGRLLLGELNCVSCHAASAEFAKKQAPVLDEVGVRIRAGWLRKFLTDPQAVKPGTTMPRVLDGDPQRDSKVEALVHFLASTGSPRPDRPELKGIILGRNLYSKVGCVACHGPRDAIGQAVKVNAAVVPLGELKTKYTIGSLAAFLEEPYRVRPSGRMPKLLDAKESREIANYLLQGTKFDFSLTKGTTTFSYYEGAWDKVPDYTRLKPKASGVCNAFDLGVALRGGDYSIRFDGYFKAQRDGTYKFTTTSDDGSNLWVDGKLVVNNDGIHPPQAAGGSVALKKGVHKVAVAFFQGGGGAELAVTVQGPGQAIDDLAGLTSATEAGLEAKPAPKKAPSDDDIDIKPDLVATGRELFASAGCANCHQMNASGKTVVPALTAAPLNKLKGEGGCMSGATGSPHYGLSLAQRAALAAAIKDPHAPSQAPDEVIARTMQTFNCYACHQRQKVGGPEEELNKFFTTTQPEMGDEARVPPPLNDVGVKMNPEYLRGLLDHGVHDRPYMLTRMPGFGQANVGPLAEAFAATDKAKPVAPVTFNTTQAKVKAAGRFLTGAQSLSCIKCHTFAGQKAEGVQGMDMTLLTRRLQRDWFQRYLYDPQALRPGTRMPGSWPNGQTFYPDLLGGKVDAQIESIWVYLSAGASAQPPVGLGKQSIPLTPTTTAIIYRNFIQGAGTRAIGVGYPEKLNLAFDANEMRLAMIWQGAFIDAARHWTDRGAGFEGPLGDNVLHLTSGAPFAVLAKLNDAWPTTPPKEHGYKFTGYRLTSDDRPTFLYSFNGVKVEDFPNPSGSTEPTFKRTLKLTAEKPVDGLYFRAAVGNKIAPAGNHWFLIDGTWKIKIDGPTLTRQSGNKVELLVPVRFADGKAEIVQEFAW